MESTHQSRLLSQDVAAQIEERIFGGTWPQGMRLPAERELVREFGASRAAVREGLRIVEARGLVESHPGKRRVVLNRTAIPPWIRDHLARHQHVSLKHLLETRELLEPVVCALAAERHAPDDARRLEALVHDMEVMRSRPLAYMAAATEFHLAVAAAVDNPALEMLVHSLVDWTTRMRVVLAERAPDHISPLHDDHAAIYRAIAAHDGAAARAAMTHHLRDVTETLVAAVDRAEGPVLDMPVD